MVLKIKPQNIFLQFKDQNVCDIIKAVGYTLKEANVFEKYGIDKYLAEFGLVVNKKYRYRGIATEMLKAQKPVMEAQGVILSSTAFTMIGSQKAATNAGFVEDFVIR